MSSVSAAIDLDGALGDTVPLWRDWLSDASRTLPLRIDGLSIDRAAAADELDQAGAGNWRVLLERFAADRAPVYLRPAAEASAALRQLGAAGVRIGLYTDAPVELARIAAAQLGAIRRTEAVEAGTRALERLLELLGPNAAIIRTREDLVRFAEYSRSSGKP
jgi:phosphoglycolate phosphatase-like HAD superfamily hydrolase